jgi:hypothetical protein
MSGMLIGCGDRISQKMNTSLAREEVIRRIKAGTLAGDEDGKVILPKTLKSASEGGIIYVSIAYPEAGKTIVFILNEAAENTMAYLYCDTQVPLKVKTLRVGSSQWSIRNVSDQHWALASKQ